MQVSKNRNCLHGGSYHINQLKLIKENPDIYIVYKTLWGRGVVISMHWIFAFVCPLSAFSSKFTGTQSQTKLVRTTQASLITTVFHFCFEHFERFFEEKKITTIASATKTLCILFFSLCSTAGFFPFHSLNFAQLNCITGSLDPQQNCFNYFTKQQEKLRKAKRAAHLFHI